MLPSPNVVREHAQLHQLTQYPFQVQWISLAQNEDEHPDLPGPDPLDMEDLVGRVNVLVDKDEN